MSGSETLAVRAYAYIKHCAQLYQRDTGVWPKEVKLDLVAWPVELQSHVTVVTSSPGHFAVAGGGRIVQRPVRFVRIAILRYAPGVRVRGIALRHVCVPEEPEGFWRVMNPEPPAGQPCTGR